MWICLIWTMRPANDDRARPVIDAGPCLNFLAANAERILLGTLGAVSSPETVRDEVLRKADREPRFTPAATTWRKLERRWIEVLSDDDTPELSAVVQRITALPLAERLRQARDLGETMVIAHAVVAAEAGASVTVLIDEHRGAQLAAQEARRLERLRADGHSCGSITIASTLTVLARAAGTTHLPDRGEMRRVYERMRGLDDGLVDITQTDLLAPSTWQG